MTSGTHFPAVAEVPAVPENGASYSGLAYNPPTEGMVITVEEFIGLIIFGIIAAVSGLAKLQEQRKEEQARKERGNRKGVDELPEATRRMLYGDGGPPVARRRSEGPPPPVALPQAEAPRPAPQRRPVPQRQQTAPAGPPWQQPPQQPAPQRPAPQRQFAPDAPRPIAQPLPQRKDWRGTPEMPQAQPPLHDYRENSVVASEHAQERARSAADVIRQEERYRSTDAAKPSVAPKPARMSQAQLFRSLARNKNALRASMITMEVMGPPKGLREQ